MHCIMFLMIVIGFKQNSGSNKFNTIFDCKLLFCMNSTHDRSRNVRLKNRKVVKSWLTSSYAPKTADMQLSNSQFSLILFSLFFISTVYKFYIYFHSLLISTVMATKNAFLVWVLKFVWNGFKREDTER